MTWTPLVKRRYERVPYEERGATVVVVMPWYEVSEPRRELRVTLRNLPRTEGIQMRAPEVWEAAMELLMERLEVFRPVGRFTIRVVNAQRPELPVRNAEIILEPANPDVIMSRDATRRATTGPEGRVTFFSVNRGRADISVDTESFHPYDATYNIRLEDETIIIDQEPFAEFPKRVWIRYKAWAYWKHGTGYRWEREVDAFVWSPEDEGPTEPELLSLLEVVFMRALQWEDNRARRAEGVAPDGTQYEPYGGPEHPYEDGGGPEPEGSPMFESGGSTNHPVHSAPPTFASWGDSGVRLEEPIDPNDPDYADFPFDELNTLRDVMDWEHWSRTATQVRPTLIRSGSMGVGTAWRYYRRLMRTARERGHYIGLESFFGE